VTRTPRCGQEAIRATLRPLFQPGGLEIYLSSCSVLIKDFSRFAQKLTERIKEKA
jgi:hypothetical protein